MAGGKKTPNSKAVSALAKKDQHASQKAAEEAARKEAQEEMEWQKGANNRKASREESAAAKADEATRKKREKEELLAAEEAALAGKPKVKAGGGGAAAAKKSNKKKNDLALLEDALVSAADKKAKMKRAAELKAKELEQQQQKHQNATEPQTEAEKMMAATEAMIQAGGESEVGRQANLDRMQAEDTSGIDNALSSLGVSAGGGSEIKSAKALHLAFEARMLPVVKEEHPGLRLTQYKEKVWLLWKKSPENPANQVPPA
ncbi:hypothetical protein ACA910_000711 [Epithemia clementina (nom. ined.)]